MSDAAPFERTTCACPTCTGCCSSQPGSLAPGDLERIAAYLGQPVRVAALKFWASPGALLGNRATGATIRIGTITPQRRHGRCVFLDAAGACTIHAVAPAGCALFDTHMDAAEGQRRALWLAQAQTDPAYQSLRRTLAPAASWRPTAHP